MIELTVSAQNDDVDDGGMTIDELEAAIEQARNVGVDGSVQPIVRVHRTGFVRSVSVSVDNAAGVTADGVTSVDA